MTLSDLAADSGSEASDAEPDAFVNTDSSLPTLNSTRTVFKQHLLHPFNRLHSIAADAAFVSRVAQVLKLPLVGQRNRELLVSQSEAPLQQTNVAALGMQTRP